MESLPKFYKIFRPLGAFFFQQTSVSVFCSRQGARHGLSRYEFSILLCHLVVRVYSQCLSSGALCPAGFFTSLSSAKNSIVLDDGRTKPIPRDADRQQQQQPAHHEYKCLFHAKMGNKKISTVVSHIFWWEYLSAFYLGEGPRNYLFLPPFLGFISELRVRKFSNLFWVGLSGRFL